MAMANRPHGRYRLSSPVSWSYRCDEVAAQAAGGSLRYDIIDDQHKDRWYGDASWKADSEPIASLDQLRRGPVVAVDLNVGHLAVAVLDCYSNPIGVPTTIPLVVDGLTTSVRDARIREAISQILAIASRHHAGAVVIENLSFAAQRIEGREHTGKRPSRGKQGKSFRRHISGLPTAKLRDRLTQMAYNTTVAVIAVDPTYTSKWGAQHWLDPLRVQHRQQSLTVHHAASVAIGKRGLGQQLRRRGTSARTSSVHEEPATASASDGRPMLATGIADFLDGSTTSRKPEPRTSARRPSKACNRRAPTGGSKTAVPTRSEGDQETQDRSGPPTKRESVALSA